MDTKETKKDNKVRKGVLYGFLAVLSVSALVLSILNVSGCAGLQGPKGDTGDQGEKGDTGQKGETGEKGDKGNTGSAGKDGTTYYYGSTTNGFGLTVNVDNVNEYHEYTALNNFNVKKGKVYIEESAVVANKSINVKGNNVEIYSNVENINVNIYNNYVTSLPYVVNEKTGTDAGVTYKFLWDNNGKNRSIVLTEDLNTGLKIDGDVHGTDLITINLNGKTVNGSIEIVNGGNVKLIGSSDDNTIGYIKSGSSAGVKLQGGSSIEITNVNIESDEECVCTIANNSGKNKITINSGTFTSHDNYVIGTAGNK